LGNKEINYVYNTSTLKVEQDHSYIVVYEGVKDLGVDVPIPTTSVIKDGILYFKSVQSHEKDKRPIGEYSLYYGSDYIKYIHATPVTSGGNTISEYIKYPDVTINGQESSPGYSIYYSATPSSIDLYGTEINRTSSGYYKLAYFNDGIDWVDGVSTVAGAKAASTFSGPKIRIYGFVGPSYGKIQVRISTKQVLASDTEKIVLDWYTIDCYSDREKESIIFEKIDLEYTEYNIEIETLQDKNILSADSMIKISQITFLKNLYPTLQKQIINPDLSFNSIGGVQ